MFFAFFLLYRLTAFVQLLEENMRLRTLLDRMHNIEETNELLRTQLQLLKASNQSHVSSVSQSLASTMTVRPASFESAASPRASSNAQDASDRDPNAQAKRLAASLTAAFGHPPPDSPPSRPVSQGMAWSSPRPAPATRAHTALGLSYARSSSAASEAPTSSDALFSRPSTAGGARASFTSRPHSATPSFSLVPQSAADPNSGLSSPPSRSLTAHLTETFQSLHSVGLSAFARLSLLFLANMHECRSSSCGTKSRRSSKFVCAPLALSSLTFDLFLAGSL
jgi:hypothetical protein